jgi:hypothetical protein
MQSAADWIKEGRVDLTDWLVHFVHRRTLEHLPPSLTTGSDGSLQIPTHFSGNVPQYWERDWRYNEYDWDTDATSFDVLRKIVRDGFIRTSWSFRRGMATIYGPSSAICFSEMPLYAMLDYSLKRSTSGFVATYAIALRRREVFRAGGRPVIYGLSGHRQDVIDVKAVAIPNFRFLSHKLLPAHEQYRYVATELDSPAVIDWTHEREWRWTDRKKVFDPPGLPIWIDGDDIFDDILIIITTTDEAQIVRDDLKRLFDGGYNRFDLPLNRRALLRTRILALDSLPDRHLKGYLRIEDVSVAGLPKISPVNVDVSVIEQVQATFSEAQQAGKKAAADVASRLGRDVDGFIRDAVGFALIRTYDTHSAVTQALV